MLVFPHTVITSPKRGAGYGGTLVQGALDDVRAKGRTIVAECPFVAAVRGRAPRLRRPARLTVADRGRTMDA